MNRKPRLYVAYGSNLNLTQMAFRCPTAKVVGKGELKDYELLFRGGRRGAVATVEPKEGSAVPVLIWDIQKGDEESLDLYEGYPNFYDKQMIEVEMDGKTISAMVYVMTPGHSFGIPSDHYANVIWRAMKRQDLIHRFWRMPLNMHLRWCRNRRTARTFASRACLE